MPVGITFFGVDAAAVSAGFVAAFSMHLAAGGLGLWKMLSEKAGALKKLPSMLSFMPKRPIKLESSLALPPLAKLKRSNGFLLPTSDFLWLPNSPDCPRSMAAEK